MNLLVKLLNPDARPPERTRALDAAYDLRCTEPVDLAPGDRQIVGTGVAVALPAGTAGLVIPRSGLAAKHGLSVVNAPGLIDESYRGELKVILHNTGHDRFQAEPGERIAQLLITPIVTPTVDVIDAAADLPVSDDGRGTDGFGSSGRS